MAALNEGKKRTAIIASAIVALAALVIVAAAFPTLHFRKGIPIQQTEHSAATVATPSVTSSGAVEKGFQILILTILVLGGISLIVSLILKSHRKEAVAALIAAAVIIVALLIWYMNFHGTSSQLKHNPQSVGMSPMPTKTGASREGIDIGASISSRMPPLFSILSGLVLVLAVGAVTYVVVRRRASRNAGNPYSEVARETSETIGAIRNHDDAAPAIIRYYARMVRIAEAVASATYEGRMTPRELKGVLSRLGFPPDALGRLTSLFELVRYGERKLSPTDEATALTALHQIADFCNAQAMEESRV